MADNILNKLFKPSRRGKVWWVFVFIIFISLAGASVDVGAKYNSGADWLGDKIGLNLPHVWEKDFRLGLDLQGGAHLVYRAEVENIELKERNSAVEGVRDVIERRVNVFGVSEPIVQTSRSGSEYRVIVELAGVRDVGEAIKMIGETPLLEFKEQDIEIRELTDEEKKQLEDFNKSAEERAEEILGKVISGGDFFALAKEFSDDINTKENGGNLGWITESDNPEVYSLVKDLKIGRTSTELNQGSQGYEIVKLEDKRFKKNPFTGEEEEQEESKVSHIFIRTMSKEDIIGPQNDWKNTELTGKNLERAVVSFNPNDNMPEVSLEFDKEGARMFEEITDRNIEKPVAIYLDGYPISVPMVNEKITGGRAVISGSFNIKEAKLLAQRLNAGALPVPITLISQQTIGASLGRKSVEDSLQAGIIGLILVALFMILVYRLPGVLAVISLIIYGILVLSLFKLWPITLTLAGIAGFILSIGMAVDANVLIFERIKEELKIGKPLNLAIDEGFKRAWPSIRDGNVSTLLTCFILIQFSTSIVKGFAVTLSLGIVISMASAIIITKNLLNLISEKWMEKNKWLLGVKK